MNGSLAAIHDIVGWQHTTLAGVESYGLAVVTGIEALSDFTPVYLCRFWLPKSGRLTATSVRISLLDMERADLIGSMPLWAEWDI